MRRIFQHGTWQKVALAAAAAGLCLAPGTARSGLAQSSQAPAPIERRAPAGPGAYGPPRPGTDRAPNAPERRGIAGEHLAQWMNQHRDLTPQQQQQALQRESGFRDLPAQTQQRMLDRLAQLDAMTPEERQRRLARIEAMEKLNPGQRAEVRGAMSELGGLPQDQRRTVARTFRELRELPPEQRVQAYASGRYGPPLNDAQRVVLFNLLKVEPMLPPPGPLQPSQPQLPAPSNAFR